MINAVLIGLDDHVSTHLAWARFMPLCWAADTEPEYVDVTSYDCRADGVRTVPTIRLYDDADPYGEPLAEHTGEADNETIVELLRKAACAVG